MYLGGRGGHLTQQMPLLSFQFSVKMAREEGEKNKIEKSYVGTLKPLSFIQLFILKHTAFFLIIMTFPSQLPLLLM